DDARHLARRLHQIAHQAVERRDLVGPGAAHLADRHALVDASVLSDGTADPFELGCKLLTQIDNVVEGVGDLAVETVEVNRQTNGKVALAERRQRSQEIALLERLVAAGESAREGRRRALRRRLDVPRAGPVSACAAGLFPVFAVRAVPLRL